MNDLLAVGVEFVQQWFQPANVDLGVCVEEYNDGTGGQSSADHPGNNETTSSLVTYQPDSRKKNEIVL